MAQDASARSRRRGPTRGPVERWERVSLAVMLGLSGAREIDFSAYNPLQGPVLCAQTRRSHRPLCVERQVAGILHHQEHQFVRVARRRVRRDWYVFMKADDVLTYASSFRYSAFTATVRIPMTI